MGMEAESYRVLGLDRSAVIRQMRERAQEMQARAAELAAERSYATSGPDSICPRAKLVGICPGCVGTLAESHRHYCEGWRAGEPERR